MAIVPTANPLGFVAAIKASGKSIYDPIPIGDPTYWLPDAVLQQLLDAGLRGMSLLNMPLRTRSKAVKTKICTVLGYPVPASFKRVQPRFPGQQFDTYTQKSDNLQIWNEAISPARRYVLVRVGADDLVARVKVVTGSDLALLAKTGTLTSKFQARCQVGAKTAELAAAADTAVMLPHVAARVALPAGASPIDAPQAGALLPIKALFDRLSRLVGQSFPDPGADQDRNRGAALHGKVCAALGYARYQDAGQFPDVPHQLLEVKLQTSPTIDLGMVRPDGTEPLAWALPDGQFARHCDVRYAVFYAAITSGAVRLTHVMLTTGEAFFARFPQFQGKVVNAKLQIPLLPYEAYET